MGEEVGVKGGAKGLDEGAQGIGPPFVRCL